jgi:hypothetical protein
MQAPYQQQAVNMGGVDEIPDPPKIRVVVRKRPINKKASGRWTLVTCTVAAAYPDMRATC